MTLTGKKRYRHHTPMFGKNLVVLQVEETGYIEDVEPTSGIYSRLPVTRWRDATLEDLTINKEE